MFMFFYRQRDLKKTLDDAQAVVKMELMNDKNDRMSQWRIKEKLRKF